MAEEPEQPAQTPPGDPPESELKVAVPAASLLEDIEIEATLQFGSRDMPLARLLSLGPGDVVELNRHVSEPIDLVVGDRIVARGEVVVASGNFALRITEVATPQLRLESIRCLF
jgi:flagellar motor switch protein FliN/FliY